MLNFLRSYNEKDHSVHSKKETGLEHHHMNKKFNKLCCYNVRHTDPIQPKQASSTHQMDANIAVVHIKKLTKSAVTHTYN